MIKDIILNYTKDEFNKKLSSHKMLLWKTSTPIISLLYLCYNAVKNYLYEGVYIDIKDYNDLSEYSVRLKMDIAALIIFRIENQNTEIDIEKIISQTPEDEVNVLIEHPILIKLIIAIVDVLN